MYATPPVPADSRPGLVTGAVILAAAGGIGALAAGVATLAVVPAPAVVPAMFVLWGAVCLGVAHGLSAGREWARATASVLAVVQVLGGVFLAVRTENLVHDGAMVAGTLGAAVLAILCTPRAGAFFSTTPVIPAAPRPLVATPGVR